MKKPVRKTDKELLLLAEKRVSKSVRETKRVPSGTIAMFDEALIAFAAKYDVQTHEVKITAPYYGGSNFVITRTETQNEKFKRLKSEDNSRYTEAKWRYDREQRDLAYQRSQAEVLLRSTPTNKKSGVCCCKCVCC